VRLWFDEDVSPTLVQVAQERGFEATCNRDRGILGIKDPQLRQTVQQMDFVLVADNASDLRPMYARDEVHPGLIVMPAGHGRERQRDLTRRAIDWIVSTASANDQTPAEAMINRLVEIDADGVVAAYDLP